jgi:hypothetical protein
MRKRQIPLWVAVKVERGYVCEARLFESLGAAQKTERRWQARLNPDYDEAAVVKGRLTASLKRKLIAAR